MLELLPQIWEHRLEQCDTVEALQKLLADRGREGWQLVNVVQDAASDSPGPLKTRRERRHAAWYAFFKRPQGEGES